mgnify:CR=1 FL=1
MTVNVTRDAINVREKLAELDKPTGIAGEAMLRAETPQEQFNLIGAGRRNLLINGSLSQWQRGISNTSVNDGVYLADRFSMRTSNNGWYRADQSTDAPEGFPYSLKITSLGSNTPSSGAYIFFSQKIEGFNTVPLAYGTASARTVTLSFYVRSSLAGTHGGAIRNNAQNRSYPFSYTINAIDTWEYKTITIVGDTTGTWVGVTNGIGLELIWNLGSGSGNIGTAGAWQAAGKLGATGEVDIVSTNGATFYITGVQLELGKVATPFEHRSYGEELALCQRYYQVLIDNANGQRAVAAGRANSTSTVEFQLPLSVGMRDITSLPQSNMGTIYLYSGGARVNTSGGTVSLNDDYLSGSPYVYLRTTGASVSDDRAYTIGGFLADAHLAVDGEL